MAHRYRKTEETINIKEEVDDLVYGLNATEEDNHEDYEHRSNDGSHQVRSHQNSPYLYV